MMDLDYVLFGFTLVLLLVGIWYACTSANISGEDDVQDDGRGNIPPVSNVVRFTRRDRGRPRDELKLPASKGPPESG